MEPSENTLQEYILVRRLGAGGMAEVFLAKKKGAAGFARHVAVKTILADNTPMDSIQLFLDEAKVASHLRHSGIVQTLDLGLENETLFIAMEYIDGPTLSRLIYDLKKMGGLLPWPIVAYIGAKVANALDYAHRRATDNQGQLLSLVHRDISPQNILLTRGGLIKLSDFGVARASIQMHKTKTGQVRGKAAYMAPEQVRAKSLDGRTDMFALALVLYEALTGFRPFHRKTDIESMRAVLGDKTTPIRELNSTVPDELERILAQCLQKDPEKRFSNCQELENALLNCNQSIRESDIIAKISEIMSDVFGSPSQGHLQDDVPAEPWHPTVKLTALGSVEQPIPQKLMEGEISGEIAKLLSSKDSGKNTGKAQRDLAITRFQSSAGGHAERLITSSARPLGSSSHMASTTSKDSASLESMVYTASKELSAGQNNGSQAKWILLVVLGIVLGILSLGAFVFLPDTRESVTHPAEVQDFSLRAKPGESRPRIKTKKQGPKDFINKAKAASPNKKQKPNSSKTKTAFKRTNTEKKSETTKPNKVKAVNKKRFSMEEVDRWLETAKRGKQEKRRLRLETILLKMMEGEPLSESDNKFLGSIERQLKKD